MNGTIPEVLIFWKLAIIRINPIRERNPILLFNTACKKIGLLPDELMYFVLETNSPMLRPVQIGRTNQLTKIIRSATAHPIVRSESAPVDNMLNKPIDTPKFQAKLIIQPMYLGIFPASSKPSGRPVGRIFLAYLCHRLSLLFFYRSRFGRFRGSFFRYSLCSLGFCLSNSFAALGLALAGFASSILSTLSSNPIFSHQLYIAPIAR